MGNHSADVYVSHQLIRELREPLIRDVFLSLPVAAVTLVACAFPRFPNQLGVYSPPEAAWPLPDRSTQLAFLFGLARRCCLAAVP